MLLVARAPVAKLETEQPWGPRLGRLGDELRRMRQQVVPTGPEASVPPGSNHSLERSGCPCTAPTSVAHEQGAFPFGWKILKSHGILQTARRQAYFQSPSSAALPADDSSPGTTEVEGCLGLVQGGGKEISRQAYRCLFWHIPCPLTTQENNQSAFALKTRVGHTNAAVLWSSFM